jgi:beta-galactosidase
MKTPIRFLVRLGLLALLSSLPLHAFSQGGASFFKDSDMMNIGVYYYPEAWPTNQWERDIRNIKGLGLEFVHMGEFAWAFMEPKEGRFDFDWLERNVQLCARQGLKVVLCTPSPTPPIWLTQKHPDVLMVDVNGRRMQHGSREQACWSSATYRQYVEKIDTELAKRFGQNTNVWGWQLDNELSHYDKGFCYCDSCTARFRAWLKQKYGTIEALNRAWGSAFWSQVYQTFDQIQIPNQEVLPAQANPHAQLDFQRWFADEAASYLRFQAGVLRRNVRNQWITSNFMNMHSPVSPPLNGKDFDFMTWTLYPVHGNVEPGDLGFRLGNGAEIGFMHDFMRNINGAEGLMELQPGQVNWGDVNPLPYPGAIYLWIMRGFAQGAKTVCTYRFREPLSGSELYHYGLVGSDGITPTIGGQQYSQAIHDIASLRALYKPAAKPPATYAARRTGLLYNVENRWDMDNHKQTVRWDSMGHVLKYYRALKRLGCPVDVISESADFSAYPFLVAPAFQLLDEKLVERWTRYVQNGGHLVLTCRTGQKDRQGHLWEGPWAAPIRDLIGASIPAYDVLPSPFQAKVKAGDKLYDWAVWGDQLEPAAGTTTLAQYADQFYAGKCAATTRVLGKGTVTYIGVESLAGDFETDLLRGSFQQAGVQVENYDDQLFVDWRDGFWVATNFTSKDQPAPVPGSAKLLLGKRILPPAGVAVWTE